MEVAELLQEMHRAIRVCGDDIEALHGDLDGLLLTYIDDPRVTELFESQDLWYA